MVSSSDPRSARLASDLDRHHLALGPEQRVLRPLPVVYPNAMSKEDCPHAAGYTPGAGSFNNLCGRLQSLGLVDCPGPGLVKAEPVLFLES